MSDVETAEQQSAKRRKIYNFQNEKVSSGGLAKPTLNTPSDEKMRLLVLYLHEAVATLFKFDEASLLQVDETMKITSTIWTYY